MAYIIGQRHNWASCKKTFEYKNAPFLEDFTKTNNVSPFTPEGASQIIPQRGLYCSIPCPLWSVLVSLAVEPFPQETRSCQFDPYYGITPPPTTHLLIPGTVPGTVT